MSSSDHVEPPVFSPLSTRRNESETSLSDTERVLLVPDPPGAAPHPVECRLVCLDEASGRLIVRSAADANEPLSAATDVPLLTLVVRPGEGVFARPCLVEASLVAAG